MLLGVVWWSYHLEDCKERQVQVQSRMQHGPGHMDRARMGRHVASGVLLLWMYAQRPAAHHVVGVSICMGPVYLKEPAG
jgi:hypothetical protein